MVLRKFYISGLFFFLLLIDGVFAQDGKGKTLFPHHIKAQFAGGIGLASIAAGYSNKNETIEGDIFYGYVPESAGGVKIHALTAKMTSFIIKPVVLKKVQVRPLSLGFFISYTFGKQYFGFTPENYPYDYYGLPTSLHSAVFIGGQIQRQFSKGKSVGLYYELISFDREIISFVNNTRSLDITDILNIALGLKYSFKR